MERISQGDVLRHFDPKGGLGKLTCRRDHESRPAPQNIEAPKCVICDLAFAQGMSAVVNTAVTITTLNLLSEWMN
jgi:hypothetical protein